MSPLPTSRYSILRSKMHGISSSSPVVRTQRLYRDPAKILESNGVLAAEQASKEHSAQRSFAHTLTAAERETQLAFKSSRGSRTIFNLGTQPLTKQSPGAHEQARRHLRQCKNSQRVDDDPLNPGSHVALYRTNSVENANPEKDC